MFFLNMQNLSERIEWVFWDLVIKLLTKSKTLRYSIHYGYRGFQIAIIKFISTKEKLKNRFFNKFLSILNLPSIISVKRIPLFLACFLLSLMMVFSLYRRFTLSFLNHYSPINTPPTPATGQHNILLIATEKMKTDSSPIIGVWLAAYMPGQDSIHIIPLHSACHAKLYDKECIFRRFRITSSGGLSKDFIYFLDQKNIWWNGYIVLDQIGISNAIDHLVGINREEELSKKDASTSVSLRKVTFTAHEQEKIIHDFTLLIEGLCQQSTKLIELFSAKKPFDISDDHIYISINPEIRESFIRINTDLVCEFPISELSQPSGR